MKTEKMTVETMSLEHGTRYMTIYEVVVIQENGQKASLGFQHTLKAAEERVEFYRNCLNKTAVVLENTLYFDE